MLPVAMPAAAFFSFRLDAIKEPSQNGSGYNPRDAYPFQSDGRKLSPATASAELVSKGPSTWAEPAKPSGTNPFANRVASVFGATVISFSLGLITTLIVNRLLGIDGKGAYVALTSLPGLLGVVGVFGLPNAINYYAARGMSVRGLFKTAIVFVAVIATAMVTLVWVTLPWLEGSILSAAPELLGLASADHMLRLILIAVPTGMFATFAGAILYARQEVRLYASIMVGQAVVTLIVQVLALGVFRLGVPGAVGSSVIVSGLGALAVFAAVRHVSLGSPGGTPVSRRAIIRYGARVYPGSLTGFFNYRADTFIIQAVLLNSYGPLGLYSMAVTMAELIFYIPNAVTTIFLPTVAGSTPESAAAKLGRVSRMTMLLTVSCAIALIPVAWVGLNLILPAYVDCMPAFLVLLPGVVSLSLSKVMTSFIAGRGRPGSISVGGAATLILNVVANIILVPRLGIVGASLSSLLSYSAMAVLMLIVACRISRQSPLGLVVPRKEEFLALRTVALQTLSRVWSQARG